MRSPMTTLCYVEQDGKYLMLHRVSKKQDVNKGKWIGIGGHFEGGESPEECLLREAYEETGLTLTSWQFRGILTFSSEGWPMEYICLYTADGFTGELRPCPEGELQWVDKSRLGELALWEGDRIFLRLLEEDAPFFSLKLSYRGDVLCYAALDGKELELFDICDASGQPTGAVTERSAAHRYGLMHRTAHVWVARKTAGCAWQLLLQRRSLGKDSFPGCYDVSAAGHIRAGDSYMDSALRELFEELGIRAEMQELGYVGLFCSGDIRAEFRGKPFHDREASAVYIYLKPVEENALVLQEGEVDAVRWMDFGEVYARVSAGDPGFCVNLREMELLRKYLGI